MKNKGKVDINSIKELQDSFAQIGKKLSTEVNILIRFLVDSNKDTQVENSLKNYLVIRYISSIEYFFKNFIRQAIDKFSFNYEGLLPKNEISIAISELDLLKKDESITVGSIIATQFNFQDLKILDKTISTLFDDGSFFKKFNVRVDLYKQEKEELHFEFDWKEFQNMFDLRHKIVHNMNNLEKTSLKEVYRWYQMTNFFLAESSIILMKKYSENDFLSPKEQKDISKKMDMFSILFLKTMKKDESVLKF